MNDCQGQSERLTRVTHWARKQKIHPIIQGCTLIVMPKRVALRARFAPPFSLYFSGTKSQHFVDKKKIFTFAAL